MFRVLPRIVSVSYREWKKDPNGSACITPYLLVVSKEYKAIYLHM